MSNQIFINSKGQESIGAPKPVEEVLPWLTPAVAKKKESLTVASPEVNEPLKEVLDSPVLNETKPEDSPASGGDKTDDVLPTEIVEAIELGPETDWKNLPYLKKPTLVAICEKYQIDQSGRKDEMAKRIIDFGKEKGFVTDEQLV